MEAAGDEMDDSVGSLGAGEIAFGFGVGSIHDEVPGPSTTCDCFS